MVAKNKHHIRKEHDSKPWVIGFTGDSSIVSRKIITFVPAYLRRSDAWAGIPKFAENFRQQSQHDKTGGGQNFERPDDKRFIFRKITGEGQNFEQVKFQNC